LDTRFNEFLLDGRADRFDQCAWPSVTRGDLDMNASEIKPGKTYGKRDTETTYRVESIDDGRVTATPLRMPLCPRSEGRRRYRFISVDNFAAWFDFEISE